MVADDPVHIDSGLRSTEERVSQGNYVVCAIIIDVDNPIHRNQRLSCGGVLRDRSLERDIGFCFEAGHAAGPGGVCSTVDAPCHRHALEVSRVRHLTNTSQ